MFEALAESGGQVHRQLTSIEIEGHTALALSKDQIRSQQLNVNLAEDLLVDFLVMRAAATVRHTCCVCAQFPCQDSNNKIEIIIET